MIAASDNNQILKPTCDEQVVLVKKAQITGAQISISVIFGEMRPAAVCRELTKKFEETTRAPLGDLAATFAEGRVKGEIVVLIDRENEVRADEGQVRTALLQALGQMKVKEAAALVAEMYGMPKRDMYQLALSLGRERDA